MHDLHVYGPPRWTRRLPPLTTTRLRTIPPIRGRFTSVCTAADARAAGTRLLGDLAVRYPVPETADTGWSRSDGRGSTYSMRKGLW
jgi:hypothetical protein